MRSVFFRSTIAAAAVAATAGLMSSAIAQNSAAVPNNADLKARCDQLISMYDRYGASRGENSDGARNHTRIGAGVDCQEGRYAQGVAEMETLLKNKHFEVPPPPTGIAQALAKFEPGLRGAMKSSGFLTRDSRVVERKKYGRAGARRRFQFSKR